jgi:aldehyde dehydrogenase (NAD+)
VTLELGGKGANLVFADADERAVERGVLHVMENTGQSCNAPARMLVERPIYERAVETARAVAEATRVGPATERGTHIGPVVNARSGSMCSASSSGDRGRGAAGRRAAPGGPSTSTAASSCGPRSSPT